MSLVAFLALLWLAYYMAHGSSLRPTSATATCDRRVAPGKVRRQTVIVEESDGDGTGQAPEEPDEEEDDDEPAAVAGPPAPKYRPKKRRASTRNADGEVDWKYYPGDETEQ